MLSSFDRKKWEEGPISLSHTFPGCTVHYGHKFSINDYYAPARARLSLFLIISSFLPSNYYKVCFLLKLVAGLYLFRIPPHTMSSMNFVQQEENLCNKRHVQASAGG